MRPDPLRRAESRHSLSPRHFRELARAEGGHEALTCLSRAEYSHRLLLFDLLMDALTPLAGVTGPLPAAQRAWDLLAVAQRHRPAAVEELLLLPETGLWLNRLLARLRAPARSGTPLWADTGHLHALAVAAAVRAGLPFSFPVPAHHGRVALPTLGVARLPVPHRPGAAAWDTAEVRSSGGRVTVGGRGGRTRLPTRPDRPAPGWTPVRRVALAPGGPRRVVVDDLGAHRTAPLPYGAATRLTPAAYTAWSRLLSDAYALLTEVDPPTAAAAALLLRSVQPLPAHEPFRVRSVTSGHGVGGMASSLPESAAQCAATLVHELQHSKLSALLHLCPLYEAEGTPARHYAPWRDDPRPLGGMLQGAYAFTAVARFWTAYAARRPEAPDSAVARFDSALWRTHLARTVPDLAADPALTPAGRRALPHLLDAVRELGTPGGGPEERLALRLAADHRATWRAAHLRPYPGDVDALAAAWTAGAARPPGLPDRRLPPEDAGHRLLDARAMLVRVGLADPGALGRLRDTRGATVPGVAGASRADLLWACGDAPAARRLHLRDLPRRPAAWTGLGLALADTGEAPEAVAALMAHPELAAAVHRTVTARTGRAPDPVALARWLGRG
ncbi:HEXXH motif domain-containing protein [Streptomyces sp. NPDC015131]|uniref:HEXXH motif domain-containing protein n=1 Tax=Streptomyces sp. NPDC015131 TaxID=3364941 RepID=UPI0037013B64